PYETRKNITSRVLLLLGAQGFIVRGLPTGSLLSQRYQWALAQQWLQAGKSPPPAQVGAGLARAGMARAGMAGAGMARAGLARRWLAGWRPAPPARPQWGPGWTK